MNYTYNPAEIAQDGVSRARFELGDTMVDGGAETCMLSDEEISAIVQDASGWKTAIEGHVCARTAADRLYNLVRINSAAALAGHIPLEDSSPLFLRNYTCRPNFNYLSQGQIQTGGRFGLLQPWYGKQPDPKLNKANFTMKE